MVKSFPLAHFTPSESLTCSHFILLPCVYSLYVRILLHVFDGKRDELEKRRPLTEQCVLDFSHVRASDNFQGHSDNRCRSSVRLRISQANKICVSWSDP